MSRWVALTTDPNSGEGGTKLDDLLIEKAQIKAPDLFVPATSAQIEPGVNPLDRKNEVRGRRGDTQPISFASTPTATIEGRAYPHIVRQLVRSCLGGKIEKETGKAPEAIESTVAPKQSNPIPTLVMWLLREEQIDRLTGCVVSELELSFPADGEGTYKATLEALFMDKPQNSEGELEDPSGEKAEETPEEIKPDYSADIETFMLRDSSAFIGPEETEVELFSGFSFTFNNGFITDFVSRFRPNHNILKRTIEEDKKKLWFPQRHKIGPQNVNGTIDLSAMDPDSEARRLMTHCTKLVFETAAGPLGTTPEADEALRVTFGKHVETGGGAEPLVREGDQRASYQFSAYLDAETNVDVEATFVGTEALAE